MSDEGPFGKAPNVTVGVSDAVLLFVSGIGFVMLAGTVYSIILTRLKSAKEIEETEQDLDYDQQLVNADPSTLNRAQRRARARNIMKQQRRITPAPTAAPGNPQGEMINENGADANNDDENNNNRNDGPLALRGVDDGSEDEDDDGDQNHSSQRHLSRKERQKAAKAAEKEERRLFEADRQKQQRTAQEAAQREKKLREQRQAELVEQQRRLRHDKRKAKEQADYEQWKIFLASQDGTKTLLVADWIDQLERGGKNRIVNVDSLAEEYGLQSTVVQQRIQELVDTARITGVFESDGRFMYMTQEELLCMANYIQAKDQVTLQEISVAATELMNH